MGGRKHRLSPERRAHAVALYKAKDKTAGRFVDLSADGHLETHALRLRGRGRSPAVTSPAGSGAVIAIMRLRIALFGVKPTAWRRIEVAVTARMADLHAAIQAAMGWEDLHLHRFRTLGRQYDPEHRTAGPRRSPAPGGRAVLLLYNHSAPWAHELRVEGSVLEGPAGVTRVVSRDNTPARRNGAQDPRRTRRSGPSCLACPTPRTCSSWPSSAVRPCCAGRYGSRRVNAE